jgi:hypothetical protein
LILELIVFVSWFLWSIFGQSMEIDQSFINIAEPIIFTSCLIRILLQGKINISKKYLVISILIYSCIYFLLSLKIQVSMILVHIKVLIYFVLVSLLIHQKKNYIHLWIFAKYFALFLLFNYIINYNGQERPYVFYENNFELIYLLIIVTPGLVFKVKGYKYVNLLIFFLVVCSGSLSSLLCYFVILYFLIDKKYRRLVLFLSFFFVLIFILNKYGINNLSNVDRLIFLKIGFEQFSINGGLISNLFLFHLNPLDASFSTILDFYNLSDKLGNNYPVSLHSLLIRLILSFGIIIAFSFLYMICIILQDSYGNKIGKILFLVGLVSSLSISGFANFFYFFGLITLSRFDINFNLLNTKIPKLV